MSRSVLTTAGFWAGAFERLVKTVAQVLLAYLAADGTNVLRVDWSDALGVALTAGALSLLSSIVSAPVGPAGSPSLVFDRPADPPL